MTLSSSSCVVECDHTSCPCVRSLVKIIVFSLGPKIALRVPVREIQSGSTGLNALISSKLVGPCAVRRLIADGSMVNFGIYSAAVGAPCVALRIVFSISLGCGGRVIHSVTRSRISSSSISLRIKELTADMSQRWHPSPDGGHSAIPNSLGLLSVIIFRFLLLLEDQVVVLPELLVVEALSWLVAFSIFYSDYVLCHKLNF